MKLVPRLKAYFGKRPGQWIANGEVQRLVTLHTTYTAANASRRLRELVEEGFLEQEERKHNGVNHAFYRLKQKSNPQPRYGGTIIEKPDGTRVFALHH